jgi:hypothetical protein
VEKSKAYSHVTCLGSDGMIVIKWEFTEVKLEETWAGDICQDMDKCLAVVNTVMNPRVP